MFFEKLTILKKKNLSRFILHRLDFKSIGNIKKSPIVEHIFINNYQNTNSHQKSLNC